MSERTKEKPTSPLTVLPPEKLAELLEEANEALDGASRVMVPSDNSYTFRAVQSVRRRIAEATALAEAEQMKSGLGGRGELAPPAAVEQTATKPGPHNCQEECTGEEA